MANMFRACPFKSPFFFCYHLIFKILKYLVGFHRTLSLSNTRNQQCKYQKYLSLVHRSDLSDHTLIFDVEGALLRSSSLFPYFMLVAFEAGGLLRALILMLTYPFVCLVGDEMGLKIMVMVCFFGIKADSFRVGRAVLPKFLIEDVGSEIFEVLRGGGKKVGVSNLPQVMVESFLREYLQIDFVVGRELKVFCGYFVGLMEQCKTTHALEQVRDGKGCSDIIAITGFNNILGHELFSQCNEIYVASEADKRSWRKLARNKYPKALVFHDGRLAVRPTPLHSLAIFMWLPFGLVLAIVRSFIGFSLTYEISTPLLALTGLHLTLSMPEPSHSKNKDHNPSGQLYVCNHRTLFDPLYLSFILKKNLIAVTYSLSRISELLAPITTVRLTRDRDQDAKMMKTVLQQGDVVVCPEGTTCREPYLLRFSPLFSELCHEILPVAVDSHVSMFYGTTAGGFKCLDPVFFLLNPFPVYSVHLLEKVCGSSAIGNGNDEKSRFEVANYVQREIGKALGFECTGLTRKDKYLILAGHEGIVSARIGKQ